MRRDQAVAIRLHPALRCPPRRSGARLCRRAQGAYADASHELLRLRRSAGPPGPAGRRRREPAHRGTLMLEKCCCAGGSATWWRWGTRQLRRVNSVPEADPGRTAHRSGKALDLASLVETVPAKAMMRSTWTTSRRGGWRTICTGLAVRGSGRSSTGPRSASASGARVGAARSPSLIATLTAGRRLVEPARRSISGRSSILRGGIGPCPGCARHRVEPRVRRR